jgi:hypothetical protein
MLNYFVTVFIAIIVAACSNGQNITSSKGANVGKHIVKKTFNNKGVLTSEIEYLVTDTGDISDGYFKDYFDNGNIKTFGFYKNGSPDSVLQNYSEDGKVVQKLNLLNGSYYGPQYSYHDNGVIRDYFYLMKPSKIKDTFRYTFKLSFDKNNQVENIYGRPLLVMTPDDKEEVVANLTDTIRFSYFFIAMPEKTKAKLTLKIENYKKKIITKTFTEFENLNTIGLNRVWYTYACSLKPTKCTAIYTLTNQLSGKLIIGDTAVCKIKVSAN